MFEFIRNHWVEIWFGLCYVLSSIFTVVGYLMMEPGELSKEDAILLFVLGVFAPFFAPAILITFALGFVRDRNKNYDDYKDTLMRTYQKVNELSEAEQVELIMSDVDYIIGGERYSPYYFIVTKTENIENAVEFKDKL